MRNTFEERRQFYLQQCASRPYAPPIPGSMASLVPGEAFYPLPILELGHSFTDDALLAASFDRIDARRDCADFALAGLLRLLYRWGDTTRVSPELTERIGTASRNFCHWYDQRGPDGRGIRGMCFHTENHQILFHGCELLVGQRFPDAVFADGKTGAWHREHGENLARRWMDERVRFGFSEWLSCYFEEDLLALLNLYDFAADPKIKRSAGMLCEMLLLEIALHSHRGVMGTTHGRVYAEFLKGARRDPLTAIAWLVFGLGEPPAESSLALTTLATSDWRCPNGIVAIAQETPPVLVCRERHGLNVADAPRFGLAPAEERDQMFFWACQTARHPFSRQAAMQVADHAGDDWLRDFIARVDEPLPTCQALVESGGATFDGDAVNTALSEVNLMTFRTLDFALSCAQDFRPGRPGYQQHIWQATLDTDAVVFTNHPGTRDELADHERRPNFWAGNRWLPRAAQHENVVLCLHHLPPDDPLPFSHAYFPAHAFDETHQEGSWIFGRKGDGYVALFSQHGFLPGEPNELRAASPDNLWICEMGSRNLCGSFDAFATRLVATCVECDGLSVRYQSPSQGEMRFGWTGPLIVRGNEILLSGYKRFDNPFLQADIGDRRFTIRHKNEMRTWEFPEP